MKSSPIRLPCCLFNPEVNYSPTRISGGGSVSRGSITQPRCSYFLLEKKTVKDSVQCHVFAQSPSGRRLSNKYRVKSSHRSRFVFAVLFGTEGNSLTVSTQSGVSMYTYSSQYKDAGRAKDIRKMRQQ